MGSRKRYYVKPGVEAWLIYDREERYRMRFRSEGGRILGELGWEDGMAIVINLGGRRRAAFVARALNAECDRRKGAKR